MKRRRAQRRAPRAGPARPRAADHPERRRPARAGRVAAAGRAARPDRRRGLPRLPGDVTARRALQAAAGRAQPRLRRAARRRRDARPTATSSSTTPHDFVVAGVRRLRRACSSRTWCSSARTCPAPRVERCYAAVDALADTRRRAAGRRLVADRDERLPVRAPGRQGGHPGGDRQPRERPAATTSRRTSSTAGCSEFLTALVGRRRPDGRPVLDGSNFARQARVSPADR